MYVQYIRTHTHIYTYVRTHHSLSHHEGVHAHPHDVRVCGVYTCMYIHIQHAHTHAFTCTHAHTQTQHTKVTCSAEVQVPRFQVPVPRGADVAATPITLNTNR